MAQEASSPGLRASSYIALVGQRLRADIRSRHSTIVGKGKPGRGVEIVKPHGKITQGPGSRCRSAKGHSKIRPLFISRTDWECPVVGWAWWTGGCGAREECGVEVPRDARRDWWGSVAFSLGGFSTFLPQQWEWRPS